MYNLGLPFTLLSLGERNKPTSPHHRLYWKSMALFNKTFMHGITSFSSFLPFRNSHSAAGNQLRPSAAFPPSLSPKAEDKTLGLGSTFGRWSGGSLAFCLGWSVCNQPIVLHFGSFSNFFPYLPPTMPACLRTECGFQLIALGSKKKITILTAACFEHFCTQAI